MKKEIEKEKEVIKSEWEVLKGKLDDLNIQGEKLNTQIKGVSEQMIALRGGYEKLCKLVPDVLEAEVIGDKK